MSFAQPKSFSPGYLAPSDSGPQVNAIDDSNNLMVRGPVHTDEGSFRDNFSGSTIGLAVGSATFTNGSLVVTGSGFSTMDIHKGDYIKLTADSEAMWTQVDYFTDTQINLYNGYPGTTSTGAFLCELVDPVTGSGGSITKSSGSLTITSGTTTSTITGVNRNVDYGPLIYQARFSISQRIASNDWYAGLTDSSTINPATARWYARFKFTGTTTNAVECESAFSRSGAPSASEMETTSVSIVGSVTSTSLTYRIEVFFDSVRFYVNGTLVATHTRSIPRPFDALQAIFQTNNTGVPASTTSGIADYLTVKNLNRLDIGFASSEEFNGGLVRTSVQNMSAGTLSRDTITSGGGAVNKPFAVPEVDWTATSGTTALATTTSTTLKAAGAAGIRNYVTGIQFVNSSAVSTTVSILDGASVIWTGYAPATSAALQASSFICDLPTPLRGTAATQLNIQCGTTAAAVYYNVQGYQAP